MTNDEIRKRPWALFYLLGALMVCASSYGQPEVFRPGRGGGGGTVYGSNIVGGAESLIKTNDATGGFTNALNVFPIDFYAGNSGAAAFRVFNSAGAAKLTLNDNGNMILAGSLTPGSLTTLSGSLNSFSDLQAGGDLLVTGSGSIGGAKFLVNSSGNVTKVNNVAISFPGAQGAANTVPINDGAGNLTWGTIASIYAGLTNGDTRAVYLTNSLMLSNSIAAATVRPGITLSNLEVATSGNQRYSPFLEFDGHGWHTTSAGSQLFQAQMGLVPIQHAGNAGSFGVMRLQMSTNGTPTYRTSMDLGSDGNQTNGPGGYLVLGGASGGVLFLDPLTTPNFLKTTTTAFQLISGSGPAIFQIGGTSARTIVFDTSDFYSSSVAWGIDFGLAGDWRNIYGKTFRSRFASTKGAISLAGLDLTNATVATTGSGLANQAPSPLVKLAGNGWKTAATAASQPVEWSMGVIPVEGSANPTSMLVFSNMVNNATPTETARFNSGGTMNVASSITSGGSLFAGSASGTVSAGSSGAITWSGRTVLASPQDGRFEVQNQAGTATNFFVTAGGNINVKSGVDANSGGIKHARVTTGSISAGASAVVTVTWTTAFADANYTVTASVQDSTAAVASLQVVHIEAVGAGSVDVRVQNTSAGSLTGTLHVLAMHD